LKPKLRLLNPPQRLNGLPEEGDLLHPAVTRIRRKVTPKATMKEKKKMTTKAKKKKSPSKLQKLMERGIQFQIREIEPIRGMTRKSNQQILKQQRPMKSTLLLSAYSLLQKRT
jgi:hypothetical protein